MTPGASSRLPESDVQVQGYCVHCRSKRSMHGAIQVCNKRGGRDLKGFCAVCGTSMYRLGGWDSVAAAQEARPTLTVSQDDTAES